MTSIDLRLIESAFLNENYSEVVDLIDRSSCIYFEIQFFYFKLISLRKLNRFADAREFIEASGCMENTTRWIKEVRQCVDNVDNIEWFNKIINTWVDNFNGYAHKLFNLSILYNKFGLKDISLSIMCTRLDYILANNSSKQVVAYSENKNWSIQAGVALCDLHKVASNFGIDFFLISGTLLGLHRDGRLLPHDYDIDIGVDGSICAEKLVAALVSSKVFTRLDGGFENVFYCLSHSGTGVKIDLFSHYLINGMYRHRSKYVAWDNTPFKFDSISFCGHDFLVPHDTDKYLRENYGDWRQFAPLYNTYLDTPNLVVLCQDDYLLQIVMLMTNSFLSDDFAMFLRAANKFYEITGDSKYLKINF